MTLLENVFVVVMMFVFFFFFKQKTAYEMRISDWSSDVCSSDLAADAVERVLQRERVDDRGQHAHVVGRGALHAARGGRNAAEDVAATHHQADEIGRASCRERVCQYV